jgi:hypothetical protein
MEIINLNMRVRFLKREKQAAMDEQGINKSPEGNSLIGGEILIFDFNCAYPWLPMPFTYDAANSLSSIFTGTRICTFLRKTVKAFRCFSAR